MLIIVILLNFVIPISSSKRKYPEINFIDVGQGDSTLIRVNNKNILIDGGGSMETENFDVGEKTLFPYLLDRGIYALDYVMVSHFDADHSQGLEYVMKNMKVKNAVISSLGQESKEYTTFLNLAKRQQTNLIYVRKGDVIKIGDCIIEILYPDNEEIVENRKNNNAIVSKITWKEYSILFTGDIEEKAEKKILNMYENKLEKLESTIIKVGHHGSKTSSTEAFIQAVKPKIALIGVGKNNKFGHPNENVLERLKNIGCKIYRTDIQGEITVKLNSTVKVYTKIIRQLQYNGLISLNGQMYVYYVSADRTCGMLQLVALHCLNIVIIDYKKQKCLKINLIRSVLQKTFFLRFFMIKCY